MSLPYTHEELSGTESQGPVVLEAVAVDQSCTPDVCVEADFSAWETSLDQEAQLDAFDEATFAWKQSLTEAKQLGTLLDGYIDIAAQQAARSALPGLQSNKSSRAQFPLPGGGVGTKMEAITQIRATAINDIRRDIKDITGDEPVETVLLQAGVPQLTALRDRLAQNAAQTASNDNSERYIKFGFGTTVIENPYRLLFQRELLARTELALTLRLMPDLMTDVLQPRQIGVLPDHMQELIALDISGDKQSLVLRYMQAQGVKELTYFDYLRTNHLPIDAKEASQAIALGAMASKACRCPLNTLGLCKEVADAIPAEDLPKSIQTDMGKKQKMAAQLLDQQFRSIATTKKISAWWHFSTSITQRSGSQPVHTTHLKRRNTSASNALTSFGQSLTRSIEQEQVTPSRLRVSMKGGEEVLELEKGNREAMDELLDTILQGKVFQGFLKAHREQKDLPDFLRRASEYILTAPAYRSAQRIIRQCVNEPILTSRIDGAPLKVFRLSGTNFPGGGKIGHDTRIYFGHGGEEGVRRIEFLKVALKPDTVHHFNAGRSVL
jgi:hypothetical protein